MTVKELITQVMREYKFPEKEIELRLEAGMDGMPEFSEEQIPADKMEWCLNLTRKKISAIAEHTKDWITFEELGRQVAVEEGLPESLFAMLNEHAERETGVSKMKIPPNIVDQCRQQAREQTRKFLTQHPYLSTKSAPNN